MERPTNLSTFKLKNYGFAKAELIPPLRNWLPRVFVNAPDDPFVDYSKEEHIERINPIIELIYKGEKMVILSRITGPHRLRNDLPFWITPLYLYGESRFESVLLEEGKGIYVEVSGCFQGKAIVLIITPTKTPIAFEGQYDPQPISPPWTTS